jgi:HAD superfamily hydrolase (TIGR01484 family)
MTRRLLICTDLDRTLIPNGPQSESADARAHFAALAARPEVMLAYVTGRHRALVERAIGNYLLPVPEYVIGDVGTTIYHVDEAGDWTLLADWETQIARDWRGKSQAELRRLLVDLAPLRLQETARQNRYKLSYYVPMHSDRRGLSAQITERLEREGIAARLIWSADEPTGIGLLDVVPRRASKYHAIEALMKMHGFDCSATVFAGDSGNDIEVLVSPIPAVLVANSAPAVREQALQTAGEHGRSRQIYIAQGEFMGMNGNYSAGILEGVAHYHPDCLDWMGFPATQRA